MPNRLATETSPYLRQHAHNPVDWYPWGDEAFARARREDRPILLSIGYAACHWCHVMERESFENESIARLMNEWFVPVKVDREERPDVDAIYMQATQAMTGHGGWPMTVFLTPDGEPFYCGTYFPPDDRHGMPSFRRILMSVADAWRSRRAEIDKTADALRAMYAESMRAAVASGPLTDDTLVRAVRAIAARYDREHGGTRGAPKFPPTMTMDFLLRRWARTGDASLLDIAVHTFRAMARGGIYDQIGGGFHRYAVDAQWIVPHFEKMLYDNALLVRHGVHLWQATHDAEIAHVVHETLAWLEREMTAPNGGFHATLDADSEGHEGKFYVWSERELRDALGTDADALAAYWGVSAAGNFEGENILLVSRADAADAESVARAKAMLLGIRERRVRPARDDKMLASWNGLMLRGVADAARAFGGDPLGARWHALALRNAAFLADTLVQGDRVMRVHMEGVTRIDGFLEDYAAVALGFLAVHELTFDARWLDLARTLGDAMVARFYDEALGAFFDTAADAERLVTRPRDPTDNATPSGTSLAVELLLQLDARFDRPALRRIAEHVLETLAEPMARHAPAFGHLLGAADLAVDGATELVLVGEPGADDFEALVAAARDRYVPSLVVAGGPPVGEEHAEVLRAGRPAIGGRATAYVCRRRVCDLPATTSAAVGEQLARAALG